DRAPGVEHRAAGDDVGAGARRPVDRAALEPAERAAPGVERDLVGHGVAELGALRPGLAVGLEDVALDDLRARLLGPVHRPALEPLYGARLVGVGDLRGGRVAELAALGAGRGPHRADTAADGVGARGGRPVDDAVLERGEPAAPVRGGGLTGRGQAEDAV